MSQLSGLTFRHQVREALELEVQLTVCEEFRDQVRFTSVSGAAGQNTTRGTTVNMSPGGMALAVPQFVPRMCEGIVRVFRSRNLADPSQDEVQFEHRVKVRRVSIASAEPSYVLGVSFVEPGPDVEARVEELKKIATTRRAGQGP